MAKKPFAIANTRIGLAANVANAGTVTVPYPAGTTQASLTGSTDGTAVLNNNMVYPQAASGAGTVAFTFGASNITVTNNSGETWPAGSTLLLSFGGIDYADTVEASAISDLDARVTALETASP